MNLAKQLIEAPANEWDGATKTEIITLEFTKDYKHIVKQVRVTYTGQKQRALSIIKTRFVIQAYIDKTPIEEIVKSGKFAFKNSLIP